MYVLTSSLHGCPAAVALLELVAQNIRGLQGIFFYFFLEFTRPKGTEILGEFTAGNLLEPAVMLNTTDEQHTLSQPTRRRANTANGKEGLKHASTLR